MAQIIYEALQKPLEKRLEEAACIYYSVEREFFCQKKKDEFTDKRRVLFLLLQEECELSVLAIANTYGYTAPSIREGINLILFRKTYCHWIAFDIAQIKKIATNLAAKLIVMDVRLE